MLSLAVPARTAQFPTDRLTCVTKRVSLRTDLGYVFIHANDLFTTYRARLLGPLLVFQGAPLGSCCYELLDGSLYVQHVATT